MKGKSTAVVVDDEPVQIKGRITEITVSHTAKIADTWDKVELTSTVGDGEDVEDVYDYLRETAEYLINK